MSYDGHLWDLTNISVCHLLNTASRKGTRKRLRMRFRNSASDRLKEWFKEATEKVLREQVLFLHRAHCVNVVVRWKSISYTDQRDLSGMDVCMEEIETDICQYSYQDLRTSLFNS